MRIAIFAAILALSACDTLPRNMHEGLQSLIGQDIHVAIRRLGYPATERTIAGETLYLWTTHSTAEMVLPTTSTTTGRVGNDSFSATTSRQEVTRLDFQCTIQLATDSNGKITHFQWEGNHGGCARYVDRLFPDE